MCIASTSSPSPRPPRRRPSPSTSPPTCASSSAALHPTPSPRKGAIDPSAGGKMNQRIQTQILAGHCLIAAALWANLLPGLHAQTPAAPSVDTLRREFLNPPDAAKPMVRWWWFGTAVVKPEILRELQQMKADGIGGAELAFEYPLVLDDSAKGLKNIPFLSPEMLDDVKYAQAEGRKLGLRIDVTLGSGWPYGGPNTSLEEAAGRLRTAELSVAANATSVAVPPLAEVESLLYASIANSIATTAPVEGSRAAGK